MEENGLTGIDSAFAREKKVERIRSDKVLLYKLTADPRLKDTSIKDLHENPGATIYYSETLRSLCEEDLRWLTKRGDLSGGTNRPAL